MQNSNPPRPVVKKAYSGFRFPSISNAYLTYKLCGLLPLLLFQFANAEKQITLETPHYRIAFTKPYESLAGEILQIAESVWPTLAKAYDSYNHYERIDIMITDEDDNANGFAIYNFSRVMIFAPHMDWVMRNRQTWLRNVVTHELAHVFTLRRAAYLSPVDAVTFYGSTYSYTDRINFSFQVPWIPLVAPTWYVEGIAQFEAAQNGNDNWDSQRDMVLRDAYLTGTLPSLDFIETFEYDEDWTQSERCYNTGFAFLLYLKDRFGVNKVRQLATPKPLFNFSYSVQKVFGKELTELYDDFKRSLAERYADFKEIPNDSLADKSMGGGQQQNLAVSSDGRFMAWIGNDDDRRAPMSWIYWKELGIAATHKSKPPHPSASQGAAQKSNLLSIPRSTADNHSKGVLNHSFTTMTPRLPNGITANFSQKSPAGFGAQSILPQTKLGNPVLGLARNHMPTIRPIQYSPANSTKQFVLNPENERSDDAGSDGLEFNHNNTRLLTTRQDRSANYTDIWEYEFRSKVNEAEKWHRLTWEERAAYATYHPSKNLIAFTRKNAGSSNLALLDSTGATILLTRFSNGEQVYNPCFNPIGDSIYFTLGIEDKEAIVAISTNSSGYNAFLALKDSAQFPDSLKLAKDQKVTFITSLKNGAIRNLRFQKDTLFWASNMEEKNTSVYNIFAKITGDSSLYRATQVPGQALEPLVVNGTLFYQGYLKQKFQIFQQPLVLTRTSTILQLPTDTISQIKTKKIEYIKFFDSKEYSGTKVALDVTPYLALQPQILSGDQSYTDMALGLSLTFGEAYGGWTHSLSGALTKRLNQRDPLNYQLAYSGVISTNTIRHTTHAWTPDFYYSLYHDALQYNQSFPIDEVSTTVRGPEAAIGYYQFQSEYSRYAGNIAAPLSLAFLSGSSSWHLLWDASFWQQSVSETYDENVSTHNFTTGFDTTFTGHRIFFKDALEHRHTNTGINLSWSKSKWGTYLPTGGWVSSGIHKWWANYENGSTPLDPINIQKVYLSGSVAPERVFTQTAYNPWSVNASLNGFWSHQKYLTFFANLEGAAFLAKAPTEKTTVLVNPGLLTTVENLENGLWAMSYNIGYYKLGGYPYNFRYHGRDIMQGSSYSFGQIGAQVPIKIGAFLPNFPLTSLKQFMLTAMGEWGRTLISAPDRITEDVKYKAEEFLFDYGLRASMNFHLYHQLPFTIFMQAFIPVNQLSKESLYWSDFPHTGKANSDGSPSVIQLNNEQRDRQNYINSVKRPRFFIGFNLGIF